MEGEKKELPSDNTYIMTDGRKAVMIDMKGKDMEDAEELIEGDKDSKGDSSRKRFFPALMSRGIEFDGAKIPMEDIEQLPFKDYSKLKQMFVKKNM